MQYGSQTNVASTAGAILVEEGKYLYCVADAGERVSLGRIGIEGHEVYTIPYQDICAVVHDCSVPPYQSDDREVVKAWVMLHQKVVDVAWERWGTVLPLSFDTIIKQESGDDTGKKVEDWLKQEYEEIRMKLKKLSGKAEYGVQVFWDSKVMAQNLIATNPEMSRLNDEIRSQSKGLGYMYRQKLENLLKREMEAKAEEYFKDFYHRLSKYAEDIRAEKTKKAEEHRQMIMNLSCLVCRDRLSELGEELDKISQLEGLSVRFTGPWPPYSFVGGTG